MIKNTIHMFILFVVLAACVTGAITTAMLMVSFLTFASKWLGV